MSKEYDLYLKQHRYNVAKGYKWLCANIPESFESLPDVEFNILFGHDKSKDEMVEYEAYDAYFYGRNRSYKVVQDFRFAWLHHIHCNPHHWQYWILNNDDPNEGELILDMPYEYIIEMICDWWAFSWAKGDLTEIFNWYDQHKDHIKLSESTRLSVETLLDAIKLKLEGD